MLRLLPLLTGVFASLTCRDESGSSVDWFTAFKHNNAFSYSILDAHASSSFKLSSYSLDGTNGGALVNTLMQIYESDSFFLNHTDGSVFVNNATSEGFYTIEKNNVTR